MTDSLYDLFHGNVTRHPERTAALVKREGAWRELTWTALSEDVEAVSAALFDLGIAAGERVSILSNTRVEWSLADFGIAGVGGVTVPIYQSNTPEEVAYILNDSGAVTVFAEDAEQVAKLRQVRSEIPDVRRVVVFDAVSDAGVVAAGDEGWIVSWADLLAEGRSRREALETELGERRRGIGREDLATLIYTSGTTGRPKGVMVTQGNLVFAAGVVERAGVSRAEDVQLLFLPLAHSFAKLLEIGWLGTSSVLAYAEGLDKVVENMAEVRPTFMASVPRVFEKVHARAVDKATSQEGLKGTLARWALDLGERQARADAAEAKAAAGKEAPVGDAAQPDAFQWLLARRLVFAKIGRGLSETFGGRLRFFVSGGAPLAPEIAYFFKYAGIRICEGYGLTETSSIATFNRPEGEVRIGTVGPAMPDTEIRLAADGEVMIRGESVFTGYWGRPEATAEVLDADGWFASGDIGTLDPDGYLSITDRKKDLIITAGGKNVAPQNLENQLKSRSPLISQVVVQGDRKPYLVALVTLDPAALEAWGKERGLDGDAPELTRRPEAEELVAREVAELNRHLPRYETIKRFAILDHDFEVGEELTPTLKVKRKVCSERYGDLVEAIYRGEAGVEAPAEA